MTQKISQPVDAVLFFDECVSNLEDCTDGCRANKNILCKHRFSFRSHVISGRDISRGLSDFRVLLRFIHLIRRNKLPITISPSAEFILVTRDKRFLRSAAKQAKTKERCLLDFDPEHKRVSWGDTTISILLIRCKNTPGSVPVDLRCIIRELNEHFR